MTERERKRKIKPSLLRMPAAGGRVRCHVSMLTSKICWSCSYPLLVLHSLLLMDRSQWFCGEAVVDSRRVQETKTEPAARASGPRSQTRLLSEPWISMTPAWLAESVSGLGERHGGPATRGSARNLAATRAASIQNEAPSHICEAWVVGS